MIMKDFRRTAILINDVFLIHTSREPEHIAGQAISVGRGCDAYRLKIFRAMLNALPVEQNEAIFLYA